MKILLLSGSLKPSINENGTSATKETLQLVKRGLDDKGYENYNFIDLRNYQLPFYDGRAYDNYEHEKLEDLYNLIDSANILIFSVPAYLCSAAGGFINLINLLSGPLYETENKKYIFQNKTVHLITVGAEENDAVLAQMQLQKMFINSNAYITNDNIILDNPRNISQKALILKSKEAYNLGLRLASNQLSTTEVNK